jgi:hypothetical protein
MPTKHYVPWNPDSGDATGSDTTDPNNLAFAPSAREESPQTGRRSTSGRKARGKYKTFNDRMDDLRRYKETHGHSNVTIPNDKSLAQFCANARYARKNPGKGMQLTDERIAAFDAIDFDWTSQEYVTRTFDERIQDLEEYRQTHGHVNVKIHEDNSLGQFCANVRYARKKIVKDGTRKLTEERIAKLDALGFEW